MIRFAVVGLVVAVVAALTAAPAAARVEPFAWLHHPHHWPTVYVEDHTGNSPAWKVRYAVREWGSGLRYGHCRPGAGCVRVYASREGANGWVGTSWWRAHGPRLLYVRVGLNDTYRYLSRAVTRQATLHELGHALGLAHDRHGVMQSVDSGRARITAFERRELHSIYGVTA